MSKKKDMAPDYSDFNSKMTSLINDLVQEQIKNKTLETKNKELEEGAKLLTNEIQTKAVEITNLKNEKEKLTQNIAELNEKIQVDKKEIDELRLIRKVHEEQNFEAILQEKNKLEKERQEIEQQYLEMKKNNEAEKAKYLELDKIFYEYKKKYELGKNTETDKITKLEEELKKCKEELSIKTKKIEEDEVKSKETSEVLSNLKKENERIKSEMEDLKTESYNKIEEMKTKMEKASQSVFSQEKILAIIAENIHNLYSQEFSLSLNKIIEGILKNFLVYSQSIFSINDNGEKNIHNEENLYLYHLKDIYFYMYFYLYNLKKSKGETDISISSNDFTEDIINTLSNDIYKNNIIHFISEDSEKLINDYMSNLKKLGVSDEHLEIIKENYLKKNEKFKIYLLNMIKSLVKKCADNIRNSTIEMNNKILYDFRNYNGEEYILAKNNLIISNDKINNENVEAITNLLKYSSENINRIQFNNNFNANLSEYNIQKILLIIMTYKKVLLSLSFNNCENLKNNVISYIMFAVQNLDKLRIISLESCKLSDNNIKIVTEGIKENKNIIAIMLRKNNITSQGALYISDYLNNNMNVKQLFLGYNNIKDKGLQALLNVLSTTNKNITNLDLSNNNFTLNDFNSLIDYLKTNPILNSLDISGNKLQLKSSINLGATLCSMKNIRSINMSNMGIISEFIPNLFKSFNLDEIILDDNTLEEVGLIMLIKGLEGNKNLKKISLKNTQLSFIGLTSLLKMLDKAKDFKELHLENNTIDDSCINIMKTTLKTKQFKIFVSANMVNKELFKEDVLGKESNIVMVE